jgi:hypothetical protein
MNEKSKFYTKNALDWEKKKHLRLNIPFSGFSYGNSLYITFAPSGGSRENFGVFRVKKHDFTPKNHILSNFRGGARRVRPPPGSAPAIGHYNLVSIPHFCRNSLFWTILVKICSLRWERIWFFGVKSCFFTRNTPKFSRLPPLGAIFLSAPPPPNLKSWIRPWIVATFSVKYAICVQTMTLESI